MRSDLRHAWRVIRSRPGYSVLSVVILALGIGVATAIATMVSAVYFQPLPYAAPDRLAFLWDSTKERPVTNLSPGRLIDFRTRARSFDGLAGIGHVPLTLTGRGLPERFSAASVSASFFDVLGAPPALGRVFHGGERDRNLVVLSHALWQRRFGGDPAIVGSALTFDGRPHIVAGVMPRNFYWTSITVSPSLGPHPELWVVAPSNDLPGLPVAYEGDLRLNRRMGYLRGVARLKDGVTAGQAEAELNELSRQLAREHPETDSGRSAVLIPARQQLLGHVRLPVFLLLGAAMLLLAGACANVANLQLIWLAGRTRELSVQAALGAGRARLARQLVMEAALVTIGGGLGGMLLSSTVLRALGAMVPTEVPRLEQVGVDLPATGFATLAAFVCGVAIALLPVARSRANLAVSTGHRSQTSRVSSRTRRLLVAAEVATAAVLVTGALLFGHSFSQLRRVDVGIPGVDRLLTFNLVLSGERRGLPPIQRVAFYERVLERIRAIPGVSRAATAATLPIGGDDFGTLVTPEHADSDEPRAAGYQVVGAGWFETLGIRLLRGRDFTVADTGEHGSVVMVNQAFADQHWPGSDPIGRRLKMGRDGAWMTVVGLVANIRHLGPRRPPRAEVYEPQYQQSYSFSAVAVRTAGDPLRVVEQVRREVARLDPSQPLSSVSTMAEHLRRARAEMRSLSSLTALFGSLSLIIAALGVYGAVGFSVAQRMREFGVRLALGAAPAQVGAHVVREALVTAAAGTIAGLVIALAAARVVQALLFDTAPSDLSAYAAAAFALTSVAVAAASLPARTAMRADPASVLRSE